MTDKAFITPEVLKWARESAKMSLETAAGKVKVNPQKLSFWEEGVEQPTIKQAEKLANSYRRPFALFFLPEVPKDFLPLQDFRRDTSVELGTASLFLLREIQQKQAWMSDFHLENGEQRSAFVGKYNLNDHPKQVAGNILATLQIDPNNYALSPIKSWITKAEEQGIFISRTSFVHSRLKVDAREIQGFAIADPYAPFIFINSQDWDAPQLFTLVHELAHLWIAASGISNELDLYAEGKDKMHPVELFCNEVAAHALIPDALVDSLEATVFTSSASLFKTAKKLGVSSLALLIRAKKSKSISLEAYKILRIEVEADFSAFQIKQAEKDSSQKQKTGGPNPYLLRLNKNSKLFTQIVLDGFRAGTIAATHACSLLNTQVNNFHKLEAFIYS